MCYVKSMVETWRTVPEWPQYEVSDLGNVRRGSRTLKGSTCPKGYRSIVVYPGARGPSGKLLPHRWSVHRAVCRAFNGERDELKGKMLEVAHLNGNPSDNRAANLTWATHLENMSHRVAHGTQKFGDDHHLSKISGEQVLEIRRQSATGLSQRAIAAAFGISREHVRDIVLRKRRQSA